MDLKHYYQKIRDKELEIAGPFAVVTSLATEDGGQAGTLTEVSRRTAAKMVVDGVARLADAKEAQKWRDQQTAARRAAEDTARASKVQLSVLPTSELEQLRVAARPEKD